MSSRCTGWAAIGVAVALFGGIAAGPAPVLRAAGAKSSKDGVYSALQAKRGAVVFKEKCAICHAANLAGGDGPPLAGSDFLMNWDKAPLSDLFTKISESMPSDKPGTLTKQQAIDLVSFILQNNKFPAGAGDLGTDAAVLKTIAITR